LNFEFDPGGFLICHSKRFMFVVIAKNASTTLKRLVYALDHPEAVPLADTEEVHEYFGYSFDSEVRIPLADGKNYHSSKYLKFAVYRNPIDRFLSVYYDKVSPQRSSQTVVRTYFSKCHIIDSDLDTFIKFTEKELKKDNTLLQDEHLRRQASFYNPSSVDYIVPIEGLDTFLIERLGIKKRGYLNRSVRAKHSTVTVKQKGLLESLYKEDYDLLKAGNIYQPRPS
jgi:hypothetical protein